MARDDGGMFHINARGVPISAVRFLQAFGFMKVWRQFNQMMAGCTSGLTARLHTKLDSIGLETGNTHDA